jgi:hypothetical protein
MPHTLRAAAKVTGRDRTTIMRAIRAGKLSATRDAATGAWLIEPAELHRLYPPDEAAQAGAGSDAQLRTSDPPGETLAELREVRARLDDALDQIQDLRRQRDRAQEQLTALLADQRPRRRAWWRWRREA